MTRQSESATRIHVLVTDPEQRAALAAVRALGRFGYSVSTIGKRRGLAGVSRYASRHFPVAAGVYQDASQYVKSVGEAVKASGANVVIPVTDRASRALIGHEEEIGAIVAAPSRAAYAAASNKQSLLEAAGRHGIRVPFQTTLAVHGAALAEYPADALVVVKPARSVVEMDGRLVSTSVRYASGAEELANAVAGYPAAAYPLMVQERIVGDGVGVFLLRVKQRTELVFGHRRIREKPPAGGVSTCRESIEPPADLIERCEHLLDELGYEGACMVEFKRDSRTDEPVLMEINARLWGSVQLAIDAGVNFPVAMVQLALGIPISSHGVARTGVRSVWELGEVDHMLALLRKSPAQLHLPPGEKSGLGAALRALLDRRFSDYAEVCRLSDLRPFLAELLLWIRGR